MKKMPRAMFRRPPFLLCRAEDSCDEEETPEVESKPEKDEKELHQKITEEEIKRTLFVGNVPFSTKTKKEMKKIFKKYGQIESVRIRTVPVKDARVQPSDSSGVPHDDKLSIFVGNMPFTLEDEVVRCCGQIDSVYVPIGCSSTSLQLDVHVKFKDGVEVSIANKTLKYEEQKLYRQILVGGVTSHASRVDNQTKSIIDINIGIEKDIYFKIVQENSTLEMKWTGGIREDDSCIYTPTQPYLHQP